MSVPQTICSSIKTYVLKDYIYNNMHWLITIIHFPNSILFPTHTKDLQFIVHIFIFLPGFLQIPVACRQIPFLLMHPAASSFEMVTRVLTASFSPGNSIALYTSQIDHDLWVNFWQQ